MFPTLVYRTPTFICDLKSKMKECAAHSKGITIMKDYRVDWRWRRAVLAFAVAVLLIAPYDTAQQRKATPPRSVRLYVFDCGSLNIPDTSPYQLKKEELATNFMSVACFLIAHPKGTLMWDAGAVPDSSFKAGAPGTLRYATSTKTLSAQLAEIGYALADITYLSLSHFHWDHVGNSNLFAPTATWLVRKLERDMMFTEPFSPRTEPSNYNLLKNSKTVIVTREEHDVFGDGTVILKSAPGHSPDHQVLFLKLAKTGPIVLSGDLYHYPEERKLKKIPTTEFNADQTAASRAVVEAFLKKTGAQLWIQHDFTANAKLKKSPQFYD
jgi:glyoxylase-like metal-dependent hydrolase (beta-lactamase superfamily II)